MECANPTWHNSGMADDRLDTVRKAIRKRDRAKKTHDAAIAEVHAAILDALANGVRQADIVRATGYTREHIRQLARRDDSD